MNNKVLQYSYSMRKERQKRIVFFVLYCLVLLLVMNLLLTFVVFSVNQKSSSMSPDIPENSLVMVSPLIKRTARGSVVYIKSQDDTEYSLFKKFLDVNVRFFTAQRISLIEKNEFPSSKNKIRRLVGMPGDTIYMRDNVLYVKPKDERHFLTEFELSSKAYNVNFLSSPSQWDNSLGIKSSFDEIVLNDDEYFVLGDNRKSCEDSRFWGVLKSDMIKGKVLFCYFPFNNFKFY